MRLALRTFHARYPCPCHDHHDWHADCEATAWCAVLTAEEPDTPDLPTVQSEALTEGDLQLLQGDAVLRQVWEQLSEGEWRVLELARCAENALKRLWRQERRYYGRCVALVVQDGEGEWVAREIEDRSALEAFERVLKQVACEQLLAQLWARLDGVERAIVRGLREGRTQVEIAQALEITQQAVSKRLQMIRAKGRVILAEMRENQE